MLIAVVLAMMLAQFLICAAFAETWSSALLYSMSICLIALVASYVTL